MGNYTVTYNVSDSSGNTAAEVTRTVNVIDVNTEAALRETLVDALKNYTDFLNY